MLMAGARRRSEKRIEQTRHAVREFGNRLVNQWELGGYGRTTEDQGGVPWVSGLASNTPPVLWQWLLSHAQPVISIGCSTD
jgi:hypothetical protein